MTLPDKGAMVVYWMPDVGIGPVNDMKYVKVPLTDVLKYPTNVVVLAFARFSSTTKPYITIPDCILKQLTLQPGQIRTNVQQLQDKKIKVLLSVLNQGPNGWDGIQNNIDFGESMQLLLRKYGLDGVDIDDEYSDDDSSAANPQSFINTIGTLRTWIPGLLLTKALFRDDDYFEKTVAPGLPNAGKKLADFLDYGWTMHYDGSYDSRLSTIQRYQGYGMPWDRLAIGVQAGPVGHGWANFTGIDLTYELAKASVNPDRTKMDPIFGMMLYTFSQDIQQFTFFPQNSANKMYPNADDHQWQRTIIAGMTGQPKPSN